MRVYTPHINFCTLQSSNYKTTYISGAKEKKTVQASSRGRGRGGLSPPPPPFPLEFQWRLKNIV